MTRLLKLLGPGFVFALTVLGPGDFVSNAATGASHGYALLWALAISVFFRFVWLDTSARYVLATGESLMEGYARMGGWILWLVLGSMFVIRTLANLYKLVLLGNIAEMLFPAAPSWMRIAVGAATAILAFLICDRGGYRALESGFKLLVAAMWGGLLVAAAMANPEPGAILRGLFVPSLPDDRGLYATLFLLMAMIGTEAGSLTNVTYSYFMLRKGWTAPSFRQRQSADLWLSAGCLFAMGGLVQIAAAGTLMPAHVSPSGAEDLILLFSETLGAAGRVIFTFGLTAAAFGGFMGGTVGYSLIAADIAPRLGFAPLKASTQRGFTAFWCFAPLALLFVAGRPVWLVLLVSALMAVLIPVMAGILLRLTSDRTNLGSLMPPLWTRCALAILIVVSSVLLGANALRWFQSQGFL
jgi:Mn2+/Fe2+ NRAMP family transporter